MPAPNGTPAIRHVTVVVYEATRADAALSQPEGVQKPRTAAESAMDECSAALRVARSLAVTLAAAERLGATQPPQKTPRVALEFLTAIHADLTAPDYDPRQGTHPVLLLTFEDICQQYGVITPGERTTCATHRTPAAGCCA
ncbi:hypothetical protein ABZ023_30875 [Streptomyces sp. NPDC006367]|uniref:hypothetical protein n=1 Tax=unclassified Streptomyces TaxID=2593676 RepID=UPI00339E23AC